MTRPAEFRAEFAVNRKAFESTIRELLGDLCAAGLAAEAIAVDDAAAYVKAAFSSLDRTLTRAQSKGYR